MSALGKTAVVTGSTSGIGFDVARSLVEKGWSVVLNGRDEERLRVAAERLAHPKQVVAVPGSIKDKRTGEAMARLAMEHFGTIDLLVNNAGTFAMKPFLDVTEDELNHYIDGNLKGTYLTTQAVVRVMRKQRGGGSIVNIGTVMVEHAASGIAASAPLTSKGGIHALTILLAAELSPDRIRVNAVAPGFIRTPLLGDQPPEGLADIAAAKRLGEVRDTTAAVLYLAEADYVTGHILNVDGGYVTIRH